VVEVNPDLLIVRFPRGPGMPRVHTRIVRSDDKKKWWAHPPGGGSHWSRSKKGIIKTVVQRGQTLVDFTRWTFEQNKLAIARRRDG
jgi:hypothetical protein